MSSLVAKVTADTSNFAAGMARVRNEAAGMKNAVSGVGSAISGAIAGLSVAGIATGIKSILDEFDRIGDLANRLDISAESLQRLSAIAKLTGADTETMAKSLTVLEKNLNAVGGPSQQVKDALASLGLSAESFAALSLEDKLYALSDGYNQAGEGSDRMAATMALLGKAGADLIPTLKEGSAALREVGESAAVVSNDDIARIQSFNDSWDKLFITLKAGAASFLAGPLEGMSNWLDEFKLKAADAGEAWAVLTNPDMSWADKLDWDKNKRAEVAARGTASAPAATPAAAASAAAAAAAEAAANAAVEAIQQEAPGWDSLAPSSAASGAFNMTADAELMGRIQADSEEARMRAARDSLTWDMGKSMATGRGAGQQQNQALFASSLAAVGGGGGFVAASGDALLSESRRQTQHLATIARAITSGNNSSPSFALG